ncbi:MAG: alpha/beta hydrolase [Leptolyngbya sp. IPPAS B-1204]|nr:MAG: alpha/beta hydrolase [Leptolyngbya sp. IPPAS B-1204]
MLVDAIRLGVGSLIGTLIVLLTTTSAQGAERIYLKYGPLLFALSVESLATFVHTGEITPELARYTSQLDQNTRQQLRQALQQPYTMNEVAVYRMTEIPVVVDFLQGLGEVINTPSGLNGFYAIRSALVLAAAEPGDWTMMDVIHHFPTDIRIDVERAMQRFPVMP